MSLLTISFICIAVGAVIYAIGCIRDYRSSVDKLEKRAYLRDKSGVFSPSRYLIANLIVGAAILVPTLLLIYLAGYQWAGILAGGFLSYGGIHRSRQAKKNMLFERLNSL